MAIAIKDVRDEESLRAFLWVLPQYLEYGISVAIAARAALRVQPKLWVTLTPARQSADLTALVFVRCTLISSVAPLASNDDMKAIVASASASASASAAAKSAASAIAINATTTTTTRAIAAARAIATAATTTTTRATAAAAAATAAVTRFWDEVRTDLMRGPEAQSILKAPLWPVIPEYEPAWQETRAAWREAGLPWSYFADWYDDLLAGSVTNWDELVQLALIDPDDWEGDDAPEKVAARIQEILDTKALLDQVERATPNAERVYRDAQSGMLDTVAIDSLGPSFRSEVTEEIETAIRRFLEYCQDNSSSNLGTVLAQVAERDLRYLREDLHNPRFGDRAFYDKIESCHATLSERFKCEGAQNDPDANRFLNALDTACLTILASSDGVRDVVHRRTEEMFYRLNAEQLLVLQDLVLGMAEDATPEFAQRIRADWQTARDPEASGVDRRHAQYNITSRLPRGARAISYSRFEGGHRVVPEKPANSDSKMWWATVLAPLGGTLLAAILGRKGG